MLLNYFFKSASVIQGSPQIHLAFDFHEVGSIQDRTVCLVAFRVICFFDSFGPPDITVWMPFKTCVSAPYGNAEDESRHDVGGSVCGLINTCERLLSAARCFVYRRRTILVKKYNQNVVSLAAIKMSTSCAICSFSFHERGRIRLPGGSACYEKGCRQIRHPLPAI